MPKLDAFSLKEIAAATGLSLAACSRIRAGGRSRRKPQRATIPAAALPWFKREIAPKLDGFTLAEIAAATGLSLPARSRIRAGKKAPHLRHWDVLAALIKLQ